MEQIAKATVQALTSLENSLPIEQVKNEISIYGKGKVSAKCFALNIVDLKRAFPKLPDGWYLLLEKYIDEEQFTDKRFTDAVKYLIKSCIYPEPTIANILSFDRIKKLYSYDELLQICNDYSSERRKIFLSRYKLIDTDKKLWGEIV